MFVSHDYCLANSFAPFARESGTLQKIPFLKAGGRGKGNSFQSVAISHDASKDGGGKSPSPSKKKGDTFLFF